MRLWFIVCFIFFLLLFGDIAAEKRERILCATGKNVQYYFRQSEGLDSIRACNIIHGNIFIVLMELRPGFVPLTNLTELIGSLNLYANDRITSLSQLFPNLSVIRTVNYGTGVIKPIIFLSWNLQLERINLTRLTYMEGPISVQSEELCYFRTVDWDRIAHNNKFCSKSVPTTNHCWDRCPADCVDSCWSEDTCQLDCKCKAEQGLERFCRFDGTKECCHINCLGGCVGGVSPYHCVACRNWAILETGLCTNATEECPVGTLQLLNQFCVSSEYCRRLESESGEPYKIYKGECLAMCPADTNDDPNNPGNCIPCIPSECRRILHANLTVMYMTDFPNQFTDLIGNMAINLEELKHKPTELLRTNLKKVRNITGSLSVYRSERIQGLDMFESLEEIGSGGCHHSNGYCLTIHSNEFLQNLWTPKHGSKLLIKNGNVSIAHNPRLCQNTIEKFKQYLYPDVQVHAEGNGDRGYCSSMLITPVKIRLQLREKPHASIREMASTKWSIAVEVAFNLSNTNKLLTLSLYYRKPTSNENLTYYDPAFCDDSITSVYQWYRHVVNVNYSSPEYWVIDEGLRLFATNITSPGLDPNSRYGIYALAQYMDGRIAISDIYFFETIEAPSLWNYAPQEIANKIERNGSYNSLTIRWPRPLIPNGNITHYIVRYWETNNTLFQYEFRGCADRRRLVSRQDRLVMPSEAGEKSLSLGGGTFPSQPLFDMNGDCWNYQDNAGDPNIWIAIALQKQPSSSSPPDVNSDGYGDIQRRQASSVDDIFEDFGDLDYAEFDLDMPYDISSYPLYLTRSGRSVDDFDALQQIRNARLKRCADTKAKVGNKTELYHSIYERSITEIVCEPETTIRNLSHFTRYRFEIRACFDPNLVSEEYLCSDPMYFSERTEPHPMADIMTADMVTPSTYIQARKSENGRAHRKLTVRKPEIINGQILYFMLLYKPTDSSEEYREVCIDDDPDKMYIKFPLPVSAPSYYAQIAVETLNGLGNYSKIFEFEGVVSKIPTIMYVAIGTSAGLLLISSGLLAWYAFVLRKKRNQLTKDGLATPDWISMNPDYPLLTTIDIPDELEVDRDDIEVLAEIGRGSFGVVYKGLLQSGGVILSKGCAVAVKSLRCDATMRQKHEFLHEALILGGLDCHHIVRLKGVVSRTQPIYVIMELMENGDLRSFLSKHRPESISASGQNVAAALVANNSGVSIKMGNSFKRTLTVSDFTQMAGEVADGLAYLSDKKIVHRDLAARNCLVARDRTVKIGDFGLARDVYEENTYQLRGRAMLPIRWMAPESLRDGIFDTYSDVWSYGVLLWEIVTLGEQPYQGKTNEEVLELVKQRRQVLNKPKGCPDKFYNLMLRCWQYEPSHRPEFTTIVGELLQGLRPDFLKVSFYGSIQHDNKAVSVPVSAQSSVLPYDSGNPHSIETPSEDGAVSAGTSGYPENAESPILSIHSRDKELDTVVEKLLAEDNLSATKKRRNRIRFEDEAKVPGEGRHFVRRWTLGAHCQQNNTPKCATTQQNQQLGRLTVL